MKAMRLNAWGQPLQLEEITQPTPASDEVLVKVHAASINPFDSFISMGYLQGFVGAPLTLGTDFAGEVVEVGSEITHVKPGDAVYGLVPMHSGSFAEYVLAKANEVAHKPQTLSYVEAAGVPLAALAAYQSLFDLGQAQKGEWVLIIGAGGTAGSCAVQMAKELGMFVIAASSPEKTDFVQSLGPDQFVDRTTANYEEAVGMVDLVLDFVGGDNLQRSFVVLPAGGRYVTSLVLQTPQEEAERRGIQTMGLATQSNVDQLDDIVRRIDSGCLKVFINCTYSMKEAQAALEYRQQKDTPGKVVLTIP